MMVSQLRTNSAKGHPAAQPPTLTDEDCVSLLQWMLQHDTTALQGHEHGFVTELSGYLARYGIAARIFRGDEGRSNLVASIGNDRSGPHLVFCGHCDTVPLGDRLWKQPPFGATIEAGRIYGRGSSDMKGGLAALIASFLDLHASNAWSGQVTLAVTFGEETGSEGASLMAEDGSLSPFDAMIIAEPTSNQVICSHKGALWLAFTAIGRTSHGSMPQMGINALEMVVRFSQRLHDLAALAEVDPLLGRPTICLTRLQGGTQVNVIPDHARAELDMRTLPGQNHDDILRAVQAIAGEIEAEFEGGKIVVETINSLPALATAPNSAIVKAALDVRCDLGMPGSQAGGASYFTDGSVLQLLGTDIVILGPGDPGEAHQTNESLDLSDFLAARRIYTGMAHRFLRSHDDLGGRCP